jgi:hypothetical protein
MDPSTLAPVDQVVHAVEAPQQRRLAAARRADQRGDLPLRDPQGDVTDGEVAAVADVDVLDVEHRLADLGGHRRGVRLVGGLLRQAGAVVDHGVHLGTGRLADRSVAGSGRR